MAKENKVISPVKRTSRAISRVLSVIVVIVIILAALAGFGLGSMISPCCTLTTTSTNTTTTNTNTIITETFVQISGSNHSVFFVTQEVVVEPEVINDICVLRATSTTYSTYYLPSESINGTSPIGIVTTTTTSEKYSTTTLYENVTIVSDSTTYTVVNSHYNVTNTYTNTICV